MPASRLPGPLGLTYQVARRAPTTGRRSQRGTSRRTQAVKPRAQPAGQQAAGPPSPHDRAKQLVREFAARSGTGAFSHIDRQAVADGLLERIDNPGKINQSMSSLCGSAAFLFDRAGSDPVGYAQFAIDLFEKGAASIGKLRVEPGKDLKAYTPPPGINPADWITLASIRDSDNWFFDLQEVGNEVAGITMPNNLAGWLEKAGYTTVLNETNVFFTKKEAHARRASELFQQGYRVCLFISAKMLTGGSQDSGSLTPDHWVVLTSSIVFKDSKVEFEVFTWGDGKRRVPLQGTLTTASFLKNYYGFVAAKN